MDHSVKELTFRNGAKGLVINVPAAKVLNLQIDFRAGEFLVDEPHWEAPHLTEHMLLGANKRFPDSRRFGEEIGRNGADLNASTTAYDITYKMECAEFESNRVIELMLIAITEPLFLKTEFEAEFENVREELIERSDDPFRHLSLSLRKNFSLTALTDRERLKNMHHVTIEDVRKHYHKTHTSKNMRFIVAGNFSSPQKLEPITDLLERVSLPAGDKRFNLPDERPILLGKPLHIQDDMAKEIYFHIDTFKNDRLTLQQEEALQIADTLLTDTYYSKILGSARSHGLIYDMRSGIEQTKLSSNWWIESQVSKKHIQLLFDIIIYELQHMLSGNISDQDIESAKINAIGRYQRSDQTVGEIVSSYSYKYFSDGLVDDFYSIPSRIESVTKDSVVDAMRSMFADDIWGIGILGDCDDLFAEKIRDRISELWRTK